MSIPALGLHGEVFACWVHTLFMEQGSCEQPKYDSPEHLVRPHPPR